MVWNRRRYPRPGRRTGRVNPPAEWTWSPTPTHEPLVTRDLFDTASPLAHARGQQGSRAGAAPNVHPQTKRTYLLRSYVTHDTCGRRMFGKTRKGYTYLACQPNPRHHTDRPWYPTHPTSIWVREDALLAAVHGFFATRILGPHRHDLLTHQLNTQRPPADGDTAAPRSPGTSRTCAAARPTSSTSSNTATTTTSTPTPAASSAPRSGTGSPTSPASSAAPKPTAPPSTSQPPPHPRATPT